MKAFGRVFVAALALALLLFACDEEQSELEGFVEPTNTPSREEYQQMINAAKRTPAPTPEPETEPDWDRIIAERAEQGYSPVFSPSDPSKVVGWKQTGYSASPTVRFTDAIKICGQWYSPSQSNYIILVDPTPEEIELLSKFEVLTNLRIHITEGEPYKLVLPEIPTLKYFTIYSVINGMSVDARACKSINYYDVGDWDYGNNCDSVEVLLPDSVTLISSGIPIDFEYIATLPNLETLYLSQSALYPDHSVTLPNIKNLHISADYTGAYSPIDLSVLYAPNVTELRISRFFNDESLSFESFPNLETLMFYDSGSLTVDFSTAPKLKKLFTQCDPFDLSSMAKLQNFEELIICCGDWDLTPLSGMSLVRADINPWLGESTTGRMIYKSLGKVEYINTLAISDAFIDDLTPILNSVKGLETLQLYVDPTLNSRHDDEEHVWDFEPTSVTVENIGLLDDLNTNIPLDQLRNLVKNGMGLQIMYDPNRQAF